MDSLLVPDGSISTDPVQIHERLTRAFTEHFICPQQYSHSALQEENEIDHKRFLMDKEFLKTVVTKISERIPGEALSQTWRRYPRKQ